MFLLGAGRTRTGCSLIARAWERARDGFSRSECTYLRGIVDANAEGVRTCVSWRRLAGIPETGMMRVDMRWDRDRQSCVFA